MMEKLRARLLQGLNVFGVLAVLATVIAAAALYLAEPLPLQVLRNALFDQYQRWQPRPWQPQPVLIVDIDEESLARHGQWPWPRTVLADLVQRLDAAGAAAIGFDIVFAEADRTSPASMLKLWRLPPEAENIIRALPDHDALLADVLAGSPAVVGFSLERAPRPESQPARPYSIVQAGEPSLPYLHAFGSAVRSMPVFETRAAGAGALTFVPDSDGVVRRVPLLLGVGEQIVPSLSAESLRVAQNAGSYVIRTAPTEKTGIAYVDIGKIRIPTTPQGELWVYYTGPVAERTLPAWKVLAGEVPADALRGCIVLVGTSAQGLLDLRVNARGEIMPGVEAHAQVLEQILGKQYLARPGWAGSIEMLAIVAGGLLLGLIALRLGPGLSAVFAGLAIGATLTGAWLLFSRQGLLVDGLFPAVSLLAVFIVASVIHHLSSEHRQRWIRAAFSRYVSPNRVAYLVDHPDDLELGGQRRECSFIFTDLTRFTGLMEKIDPADAVSMLNTYLDDMLAIAFRHEGTLDRIVGDSVAIMFSAPVTQPDHRQRALDCALEMHAFASAYAARLNAQGIAFGQTRIGVHSGEVIVGNFGGSTMFDYRALGDTVNTASRLEAVNKHLGTLVCVSEATLAGCSGILARPIGQLVLKGKMQPLMVYEPLAATAPGKVADEEYRRAYALLDARAPEAVAAFAKLAKTHPHDPLVALHLARLQAGEEGSVIAMSEK